MKKIILNCTLIFCSAILFAQDDKKPVLSWNAYADLYYTWDFSQPENHNRPSFIYSHNRTNEFNLNLGFVKGSLSAENYRASLALAAGTYMNANYAAEPGVLKNIYEASAGVKLSKKHQLWFDIGIMPSHIGFESAVSKDCWTLTRSILAENSPYYESGAKIGYTSGNGHWFFSGLILNGWQKINRPDGYNKIAFGTQITFKPSAKLTVNHSSFFGSDKPDSLGQYRIFQNLYGIISLSDRLGLTLGFDYGMEEKASGESGWNTWYSPVVILRYQWNDQWATALRGEFYEDKTGVIIPKSVPEGFSTAGFSLNIDYMPVQFLSVRMEARTLQSQEKIFTNKEALSTKNNTSISFSTAVFF